MPAMAGAGRRPTSRRRRSAPRARVMRPVRRQRSMPGSSERGCRRLRMTRSAGRSRPSTTYQWARRRTDAHRPSSAGSARHGRPVASCQSIASITARSSIRLGPLRPSTGGSAARTSDHSSSVSGRHPSDDTSTVMATVARARHRSYTHAMPDRLRAPSCRAEAGDAERSRRLGRSRRVDPRGARALAARIARSHHPRSEDAA